MPMPAQRPGRSKQDYGTPPEFLDAVRRKLGIHDFILDLAADDTNHICAPYLTEADDSLTMPWGCGTGWAWLNPPFGNIRPWVKKAWEESQLGANIAVLVPAGVGANWWRDWVHNKAHVLFLNGRLTFVGAPTVYPKDCALLLYNRTFIGGYNVWNWREE